MFSMSIPLEELNGGVSVFLCIIRSFSRIRIGLMYGHILMIRFFSSSCIFFHVVEVSHGHQDVNPIRKTKIKGKNTRKTIYKVSPRNKIKSKIYIDKEIRRSN